MAIWLFYRRSAAAQAALTGTICLTRRVAADVRTFTVTREPRSWTVVREDRTFTVASEPRTFPVVCC